MTDFVERPTHAVMLREAQQPGGSVMLRATHTVMLREAQYPGGSVTLRATHTVMLRESAVSMRFSQLDASGFCASRRMTGNRAR